MPHLIIIIGKSDSSIAAYSVHPFIFDGDLIFDFTALGVASKTRACLSRSLNYRSFFDKMMILLALHPMTFLLLPRTSLQVSNRAQSPPPPPDLLLDSSSGYV